MTTEDKQSLNPRWLAYMRTQGFTDPALFMLREEENWPGGKMTGFTLWISANKRTFARRFPRFMFDPYVIANLDAWDEYLRSKVDCEMYDRFTDRLDGFVVDGPGWLVLAKVAIGHERPPGPRRTPSPRCQSGKRPYCSCDTCY